MTFDILIVSDFFPLDKHFVCIYSVLPSVIPAKAGIQKIICIDSHFHGNDKAGLCQTLNDYLSLSGICLLGVKRAEDVFSRMLFMNPQERKIIFRIVENGGLREPYEFGAYRQILLNEAVEPRHVENIKGRPYVPVRIYGPKPPEAQDYRKISPMP